MASLNRVTLIGNVGRDPEFRTLNSGDRFANFSLAMSEAWTDKASGEKREKTEWANVVIFNQGLVGIVEKYVSKGSKLFVEGKFATRKWEKDGVERYSTEVVLNNFDGKIVLLGDPKGGSDGAGGGGYQSASGGAGADQRQQRSPADDRGRAGGGAGRFNPADMDDEIPF